MTFIRHYPDGTGNSPNYFKDFKVGNIITTYYKGYFKLTKIERRFENKNGITDYQRKAYSVKDVNDPIAGDEIHPLFHFKIVASADGKPKTSKLTQSCCSSFCKSAFGVLTEKLKEIERTKAMLLELSRQII